MKHSVIAAAFGAAFLLAGCASSSLSTQESLLIACRGYTATLTSLAGFRAADRLSDDQVATVEQARPILNQACSGEVMATDDLLAVVEAGLIQMIFIEKEVRDES
ncbi:hypothetical protein [Denitrobaculum tricleocarpae]|uniref:Lipoprotein n=1 Tax=Denitrobaculum tricleocarpae TaxID=2591009 RepID=A0A545TSW0_9PROT|nr:hypothetical protein [Denitrobaculum tricleocarpae]TQV80309.1 hypothetical protein FKG95_08935 [Denitrobaculum tricleocarpae]